MGVHEENWCLQCVMEGELESCAGTSVQEPDVQRPTPPQLPCRPATYRLREQDGWDSEGLVSGMHVRGYPRFQHARLSKQRAKLSESVH